MELTKQKLEIIGRIIFLPLFIISCNSKSHISTGAGSTLESYVSAYSIIDSTIHKRTEGILIRHEVRAVENKYDLITIQKMPKILMNRTGKGATTNIGGIQICLHFGYIDSLNNWKDLDMDIGRILPNSLKWSYEITGDKRQKSALGLNAIDEYYTTHFTYNPQDSCIVANSIIAIDEVKKSFNSLCKFCK
ncbi:MAG: hypothetical protein AAFN65_02565 [Bacteroidota bacterium]